MGGALSQMFPPRPDFTDAQLPNQSGKVVIVTGGYSGVGYELASILYQAGAKVYIAGRSKQSGEEAIAKIQQLPPRSSSSSDSSTGSLQFFHLDLADLSTIKDTVQTFQSAEPKLDILFNNAGVSLPPAGATSAQGFELQLATNCLGPYLLTQLLLPQLLAASDSSNPARVIWTSSQVVELSAPTGGLIMSEIHNPPTDQSRNYTNSKTGNYLLASELARREPRMLSLTTNPGGLKTNLLRNTSAIFRLAVSPLLYHARFGAYTELYAGCSEELTISEHNGAYIIPWGRVHTEMRKDILGALKGRDQGGSGIAEEFWEWCEESCREFR